MFKFSKYYIRKDLCKKCMVCFNQCPIGAIKLNPDNTLEIIQEKCDSCGICKEQCKLRVITKKFTVRRYKPLKG